MKFIEWIKKQTSPEAKLERLQAEVEREETKANLADKELSLLERKNAALETINKRDSLKKSIREKRMSKFKETLGRMNAATKGENIKLKSPSDRVYNN